ncbi:MAG: hypothetical protein JNL23_03855, partial [Chitinophagaceae bacterium]|nr:hypothetical protein [Chitinophagaceae bacterium]
MRFFLRYLAVAGVAVIFLNACNTVTQNAAKENIETGWEKIGPGGGGATFIPTFSYHDAANFLIRCDMTGSYLTKDGG